MRRQNWILRALAGAAVVTGALALAACGGSDDEIAGAAAPPPPPAEPASPSEPAIDAMDGETMESEGDEHDAAGQSDDGDHEDSHDDGGGDDHALDDSDAEGGNGEAPEPGNNEQGAGSRIQIAVAEGEPVDGVTRIEVSKGDRVRFTVTSDQPGEVHVHGFDITKPVTPEQAAKFNFVAKFEGIFEVAVHLGGDIEIAKVVVEP